MNQIKTGCFGGPVEETNSSFLPIKLLITGSRSYTNKERIREIILSWPKNTIIVHGGCPNGTDQLVHEICQEEGYKEKIFRPIDNQKISYLYRNAEMVGYCDKCINEMENSELS